MRLAIPLLAILLGLIVAVGAFYNAAGPAQKPSAATTQESTAAPQVSDTREPDAAPPDSQQVESADEDAPVAPTAAAPHAQPPAPIEGLHILPAASPGEASLGSINPDDGFRMRIDLTRFGAGVRRILLTDHRLSIKSGDPYVVHDTLTAPDPAYSRKLTVYPYAARYVTVNGTTISLETTAWTLVRSGTGGPATEAEYRITLADAQQRPVLDIIRRYTLARGSYDFGIEQHIVNRGDSPLQVTFEQYIQGDLPLDDAAYLGDRRLYVTGYFHPRYDAARTHIYTTDAIVDRGTLLKTPRVWPNENLKEGVELAWLASENRYFAVVTHAAVPDRLASGAAPTTADVPPLEKAFPRVSAVVFPADSASPQRSIAFTLGTPSRTLNAGETMELPLGVFAGPRESDAFKAFPYPLLNLDQLVRYELGCTWCTFQWLARGLLYLLEAFHWLVRDWGIAIILLVLLVRLILHPITKKAQINMMKMGKQMQAIQPEVEKLKKKYAGDQTRLNQEVMKLYREKHINPANMLGCLPLLLQTPIWIALYAMLYFAIELRHEPAFYGVFQWISGGAWSFLADLSSPDHFIEFGGQGAYLDRIPGTSIDFIPFIDLHFAAINILPILMGVVFYFNMKFTTPPPPTTNEAEMTEQQRMMLQQQKIMRWVFPFMMPVFMYAAPSGLTLYICASTFAGIIDSYIVRKHVRDAEASGRLFEHKPAKPGGFRDRMNRYMQQKQAELMAKQDELQRNRPPGDKRR